MNKPMEQTLVLLKPEAVVRRSVGAKIIEEINQKYTIKKMSIVQPERAFFENTHYVEHNGKPFFNSLINHMTTAPIIAMVVEGENAVLGVRELLGATMVEKAMPETLRGKYGIIRGLNCAHASDSTESANKEINNWTELMTETINPEEYVKKYENNTYINTQEYRNGREKEDFKKLLTQETDMEEKYVDKMSQTIVDAFNE